MTRTAYSLLREALLRWEVGLKNQPPFVRNGARRAIELLEESTHLPVREFVDSLPTGYVRGCFPRVLQDHGKRIEEEMSTLDDIRAELGIR